MQAVNPYNTPPTSTPDQSRGDHTNPVKPLLLLVGGLYALFSPMAFLSGLQAGLHVVAGSVLMLVLGCGTMWLALRPYTPAFRSATIVWGFLLVCFFLFTAVSAYDPTDVAGTVFFGFVLLIVTPIPILALRYPPQHRLD